MPPEINPVNENDCACLDQVRKEVARTRELIEACKRCNMPMEQEEKENNAAEQAALAILREFAPMKV